MGRRIPGEGGSIISKLPWQILDLEGNGVMEFAKLVFFSVLTCAELGVTLH